MNDPFFFQAEITSPGLISSACDIKEAYTAASGAPLLGSGGGGGTCEGAATDGGATESAATEGAATEGAATESAAT